MKRFFLSVQNWKYILKTLAKNKTRTVLTALGIVIGVWAVIVLIAIGNGLKGYVDQQFRSLGSNSIYVLPIANMEKGGFGQRGFPSTSFNEADVKNLKSKVKNAKLVLGMVSLNTTVSFQKNETVGEGLGAAKEIRQALNLNLESGRFYNEAEEDRGKKVVALGWKIKDKLFGENDALNKKVRIEDQIFTIIGVVKKKGGDSLGSSIDDHIYLPYKTAWKITEKKDFNTILIEAENKESIETVKSEIKKVLLEDYDKNDFSVVDQTQLLGVINNILNIFTIALSGIAAISLIVGGVGIMNVMYVSVNERTREIGLRKAVGATNKDILLQFLAESIALSGAGGALGFALAFITAISINHFFPTTVAPWSIILALTVSSLVGIVFGITPASRASKLSPVEALRYE